MKHYFNRYKGEDYDDTMPRRILHVAIRVDYGGVPNYISIMINHLSKNYEVYLACPKDKPYYEMWKKNDNVKDIFVLPHRKFSFQKLLSLRKFIIHHKIDVLQANGKGAGLYGRLVKPLCPGLKVVFAYRGFHIYTYGPILKRLYFLYERLMLSLTDRVINVSKGEQKLCIAKGALTAKKSVQIYNGIQALPRIDDTTLASKYKDKFVIVTLSRFDIQKNMQLMYTIARDLMRYPEIHFVFIGDGEDKAALEKKAHTEGTTNIDFVGFKNHTDIAAYFGVSSLYLTTSLWEGLPFALVEAISVGLPIVATDVVGNNEVCLDGVNGITYPMQDKEKAVVAILKLYNDSTLREKYAEASKVIFEQQFTVKSMVAAHEHLYKTLLNDK